MSFVELNRSLHENVAKPNYQLPLWKNPNPTSMMQHLLEEKLIQEGVYWESTIVRVLKGAAYVAACVPLGILCLAESVTKLALAILLSPAECFGIHFFRTLAFSALWNGAEALVCLSVVGKIGVYVIEKLYPD